MSGAEGELVSTTKAPVQVSRRIPVDARPELDLGSIVDGQVESIGAEIVQLQRRIAYLHALRQAKLDLSASVARVMEVYEGQKGL